MTTAEVYRKAGFPARHGEACQEVANETDRIIVSRCAQEIGIQLLEENYASKGFGIKPRAAIGGRSPALRSATSNTRNLRRERSGTKSKSLSSSRPAIPVWRTRAFISKW